MKLSSLPIAAFVISIFLVSSSPVDARPVTTADLAGTIICWGDGNAQAFSADGKTANRQFQDGQWSIGDNGVQIKVGDGVFNVDIEIAADGTFTSEYKDSGGTTHNGVGKICKGKPQKLADLPGKKMCWDGGTVETDFPGGRKIRTTMERAFITPMTRACYRILDKNISDTIKYSKASSKKSWMMEDCYT